MISHDLEARETFVENSFGDRYLFSVNREVFNRVGSDSLFHAHFGESIFKEDALHVFVGSDSGLLPKYITKKGVPSGARYIFIEPPEIQAQVYSEFDGDPVKNDKLTLIGQSQLFSDESVELLQKYQFLNRIFLYKSIAAEDAFLPDYAAIFSSVHQQLNQFAWQVNGSLGNEAFILRQLENIAENRISALCLKNSFRGKTVVLLAGGPSLDDIFPWLSVNRDKVAVLAVSRVCRRLREVGIDPDIVFSIDPHDVSFDVSKDMLRLPETTLFINLYHVVSQLLGQWRGRHVYIGARFPWESPLNVESFSAPGPTVTNLAISTAIEMGFSQVLLSGLDLCFSKEGFTHALGSNERQAGPQLDAIRTQVETNGGWMAETDPAFAEAIGQVANQARQAKEKGAVLVNTAAAAAKIPGVLFIQTEQIEVKPLEKPVFEVLQAQLPEENSGSRIADYRAVLDELGRAYHSLNQIKKLSCEALEANEGLFGRKRKTADFRFKIKMDKIERKLDKGYPDFVPLVKKFGIRHFLKISRVDTEREWSDEEIEETGRVYYEAYRDSSSSLLNLVKEAQTRISSRLEEENPSPCFDSLIQQWKQDRQPGRALVWMGRRGTDVPELPSGIKGRLAELETEFAAILDQQETAHLARSRKFADLSGISKKAHFLFKNRERDTLENLASALAHHPDPAAKPYLVLVQGYLAELDSNFSEAMNGYTSLLSEEYEFLEDVLRRIARLSLTQSDLENARMALEYLSSISPVYMPQYAELLRLLGMHRQALDTYADYLERVPGDVVTMMKLGQFYAELGIAEGSRLMYSSILEIAPGNTTAKKLLEEMSEG